jgi:hypothetical protein
MCARCCMARQAPAATRSQAVAERAPTTHCALPHHHAAAQLPCCAPGATAGPNSNRPARAQSSAPPSRSHASRSSLQSDPGWTSGPVHAAESGLCASRLAEALSGLPEGPSSLLRYAGKHREGGSGQRLDLNELRPSLRRRPSRQSSYSRPAAGQRRTWNPLCFGNYCSTRRFLGNGAGQVGLGALRRRVRCVRLRFGAAP